MDCTHLKKVRHGIVEVNVTCEQRNAQNSRRIHRPPPSASAAHSLLSPDVISKPHLHQRRSSCAPPLHPQSSPRTAPPPYSIKQHTCPSSPRAADSDGAYIVATIAIIAVPAAPPSKDPDCGTRAAVLRAKAERATVTPTATPTVTGMSTPSRSHSATATRPTSNGGFAAHAPPVWRGVSMGREGAAGAVAAPAHAPAPAASSAAEAEGEEEDEEDVVYAALRQRWDMVEGRVAALFGAAASRERRHGATAAGPQGKSAKADEGVVPPPPPTKAARQIDDDYGDDEDEEEEEQEEEDEEAEEEAAAAAPGEKETPVKAKPKPAMPNGLSAPAVRSPVPSSKPGITRVSSTNSSGEQAKSSEDVRKQLEESKKAAADAARRSFQAMFYTWENDRDAMLEQHKLDELDREVENEVVGPSAAANGALAAHGTASAPAHQGTLGSADLGASSLTLKHLIARIDAKRDMVKASDNQLRTLISEVRKGRSKWASEDRVGQEELYEAAEKVLMELKAMTEYAQPFLQRVAKRDAPDYFTIIKNPMDIGTMLKKLKSLGYRSKKEFVDDLNLIWANCLKYNSNPDHPFRKKALHMRKETDKLTPLIPDIVVRDRAEVEAEERREQSLLNTNESDDDDDDAPLASRGRKAPKKGSKAAPSSARKAPAVSVDDTSTPAPPDVKPAMHPSTTHLRNEFLRADSEMQDASSTGFSTPPPGNATPWVNGVPGSNAGGSQADVMEVDGFGQSILDTAQDDPDEDDTEFKTWKQITMNDRARAAAERNRLFHGDRLNAEEPALLRTRAGMRRWQRQQKMLAGLGRPTADSEAQDEDASAEQDGQGETLAEGIEKDEDSTLPDYYDPLSSIPDLRDRWRWATDSEGQILPQAEEWLRIFPRDRYRSHEGSLTRRMDANMRQMQDTRRICSKIGLVKQMQIQGQTYQNQFQKYEPQPFVEQDVGPVVVSEAGPLMSPCLNRAALQRAVGKIFYHAGFEDFQPSALDCVTDLAGEYLGKVVEGFKAYREQPRRATVGAGGARARQRFSFEEQALHMLQENGVDLDGLEGYVREDVERLATKLGVVHERMKAHLADLLVGAHSSATEACDCVLTDASSDPRSANRLAPTAPAPSKTAASNSSAATLPRTWTKISSASANSASPRNSGSRRSLSPCTCCRTACTARTRRSRPRTAPCPRRGWCSRPLRRTSRSRSRAWSGRSGWCASSSGRSSRPTGTRRWWRTRSCRPSRSSRSRACRRRARSRARGSGRSASSSRWRRSGGSSRRRARGGWWAGSPSGC